MLVKGLLSISCRTCSQSFLWRRRGVLFVGRPTDRRSLSSPHMFLLLDPPEHLADHYSQIERDKNVPQWSTSYHYPKVRHVVFRIASTNSGWCTNIRKCHGRSPLWPSPSHEAEGRIDSVYPIIKGAELTPLASHFWPGREKNGRNEIRRERERACSLGGNGRNGPTEISRREERRKIYLSGN